ncbi:MAG: molybdopterin-dependent oxidoreductase [Chloroflexi bacterium]|nr:molybdopterin-dependent oxidoreductase [Chloroflexota bacterium]
MAKLTIDGREVEVPSNSSILEAARLLDINVPTYCWDPRMKPYGACRLCMVEANGRLVASCCTTVRDGMTVLTTTPECIKSRREMVAYLLVHHPLDCPYCDKSGDCELQQRTYEMGIGEVPVRDEKVTVPVDFQHPVVEPFLTRCIVCGKCVRACDEIRGEGAIELVNRGFETVVDTNFGQALECTSCGECIEVCPVGALTSKVFKFKNRAWQMQKTHTTCNYCSVGCTMDLEHFKGQVRRVRAHPGYGHNDGFLCALGRFGYDFIHHENRITVPYVRRVEGGGLEVASWDEALDVAATKLAELARHNPKSIGVLGSRRISNEDALVLQRFARTVLNTPNVDSAARTGDWPALKAILDAGLKPIDNLNAEVRKADVIVIVGDASQAADIASVKMQNASRYAGATLVQINPYRTQLSKWKTIDLRVKPLQEAAALTAVAARVAELRAKALPAAGAAESASAPTIEGQLPNATAAHGLPPEAIEQAAQVIAGARGALFALCTGHWLRGRAAAVGAAVANLVLASGKMAGDGNGIVYLPEKNNSWGSMEAGLLADMEPAFTPAKEPGLTADSMLAEGAGLQALYVVGENIYDRLPGLPFLIVQDIMMSETARRADVLFPAGSYAERQGTFSNFEGRPQWFNRAIPPVGQSRPDWHITAELARRVSEKLGKDTVAFSFRTVVDVTREFEKATGRDIPQAPVLQPGRGNPVGSPLHAAISTAIELRTPETPLGPQGDSRFNQAPGGAAPEGAAAAVFRYQPVESIPAVDGDLVLITAPQRWVNGTTARHADGLVGLYPTATVALAPSDAARLGIGPDDQVRVSSTTGAVLMRAEINRSIPRGVAVIPGYVQPSFVVSEGEAIGRLLSGQGAVAVTVEKREERELGFAGFNEQVAIA